MLVFGQATADTGVWCFFDSRCSVLYRVESNVACVQLLGERSKRCMLERKINNMASKLDELMTRVNKVDIELQRARFVREIQYSFMSVCDK